MRRRTIALAIEDLLREIRSCTDCDTPCKGMPFVYGSPRADILVVSEGPSKTAWRKDIGRKWEEEGLFSSKRGVTNTLCEWLGMKQEEAQERFFWIHRANCYVEKGREYALQHCSSKYIRRILDAVRPRLIIMLGRSAANYFFQFERLGEVVEGCPRDYKVNRSTYPCFVLYHPSSANRRHQGEKVQKETVEKLRILVEKLRM